MFFCHSQIYSIHTHTCTHTKLPVVGEVAGHCNITVCDKSALTHTNTVVDFSFGLLN